MGRMGCRDKVRDVQGVNEALSEHRDFEKSNLKEIQLTTQIHCTGTITQVITPPPGWYCRPSPGQLACLVIIKKQVVQFVP